jgi:hypothetical protein
VISIAPKFPKIEVRIAVWSQDGIWTYVAERFKQEGRRKILVSSETGTSKTEKGAYQAAVKDAKAIGPYS